jgi:hypothetical protein
MDPTIEQQPSRANAILSMEFGDCSIIAAQTAMVAEEIFLSAPRTTTTVYDDERSYEVDKLQLTEDFTTTGGRDVHLGLVQYHNRFTGEAGERLYLAAFTRGDVIVPLASFARRHGELCDYVQIGSEMTDIVATPADEVVYDRKQTIELIRAVLDQNSREAVTLNETKVLKDTTEQEFIKLVEEQLVKSKFKDEYHLPRFDYDLATIKLLAAYTTCYAAAGVAMPARFMASGTSEGTKFDDLFITKTQKKERDNWLPGTMFFISNRSYIDQHLIVTEVAQRFKLYKVRGHSNEARHQLMVEMYSNTFDYLQQKNATPKVGTEPKSQPLAEFEKTLDIDSKFNDMLGELDPAYEGVVACVGRIALNGNQVDYIIKETVGTIKDVDVDISVETVPVSDTSHRVKVSARPVAMADKKPAELHSVVVDRAKYSTIDHDEAVDLGDYLAKAVRILPRD